jgi:hypothetical protein
MVRLNSRRISIGNGAPPLMQMRRGSPGGNGAPINVRKNDGTAGRIVA